MFFEGGPLLQPLIRFLKVKLEKLNLSAGVILGEFFPSTFLCQLLTSVWRSSLSGCSRYRLVPFSYVFPGWVSLVDFGEAIFVYVIVIFKHFCETFSSLRIFEVGVARLFFFPSSSSIYPLAWYKGVGGLSVTPPHIVSSFSLGFLIFMLWLSMYFFPSLVPLE